MKLLRLSPFCALLILAPCLAGQESRSLATTGWGTAGESWQGSLLELKPQGVLAFTGPQQEYEVEVNEFAYWGQLTRPRSDDWILTRGGSLVVGRIQSWSAGELELESLKWQRSRIATGQLAAVVLRPPLTRVARDSLFQRLEETSAHDDVVLLDGGDTVRGVVLGLTKGNGMPASVLLQTGNQPNPVSLPRSQVQAVILAGEGKATAGKAQWVVGLGDGSRLMAESVTAKDGAIQLDLNGGTRLLTQPPFEAESSRKDVWRGITYLRHLQGRLQYLSDMQPVGYKHIPFLTTPWPYRMDRAVSGGRLSSGGVPYEKGIGMHSTSRLAFDLPSEAIAFHAELALDDRSGRRGSVLFLVYVQARSDGPDSAEWELAYQSPVIRGRDPSLPIQLDLAGAARLALVVGHADHGDVLDHANWLQARIVLQKTEP